MLAFNCRSPSPVAAAQWKLHMPDPSLLQTSMVKAFIRTKPSFHKGMQIALDEVIRRSTKRWAKCRPALGVLAPIPDRWISWFDALIRKCPPPSPTEVLWFEYPSELNPALTSVSGYAVLDVTDESFGLDEGRQWPVDKEGLTRDEGLLPLPELDEFVSAAGWQLDDVDACRGLEAGYLALTGVATTLLVLNHLPDTAFASSSERPLGVVGGLAAGDIMPIGQLDSRHWKPLRRRASSKPKPDELDPTSMYFNLDKYLAHGGDPNWRDPDDTPLIVHLKYGDSKAILAALRAGADPSVPLKNGLPTIFEFIGREIPELEALVKAGADPRQLNGQGESLLEWMAGSALRPTEHLDWCVKHGVSHRPPGKGFFPLHSIASCGPYERGHLSHLCSHVRWWMNRAFSINDRDSSGHTPLTHALARHADELDRWIERLRQDPEMRGHGFFYQHDRVAEELLKLGADPNVVLPKSSSHRVPEGGTTLMLRRYDTPRLTKALLKHGADPTRRCPEGRTALDYARIAAKAPEMVGHESAAEVVTLLERALKRWPGQRPDR